MLSKRKFITLSALTAFAGIVPLHAFATAKNIFKSLINNGTWNLVEGIELHIKYSFPSGHTASAFCILISMCFLLNNNFYSFLMVGVAFIIGFSRIYLSQHFLIDVIIGAIIGSLIPFFTHIYLQPIISRKILKRKIE